MSPHATLAHSFEPCNQYGRNCRGNQENPSSNAVSCPVVPWHHCTHYDRLRAYAQAGFHNPPHCQEMGGGFHHFLQDHPRTAKRFVGLESLH